MLASSSLPASASWTVVEALKALRVSNLPTHRYGAGPLSLRCKWPENFGIRVVMDDLQLDDAWASCRLASASATWLT